VFHRSPKNLNQKLDPTELDWWRDEPHADGQTHAIVEWFPNRIPVSLLLRATPVSTKEPDHFGWMQVAGVAIGVQADPALQGQTKFLGKTFEVDDAMSWPVLPVVPMRDNSGDYDVKGVRNASKEGAFLIWEPDDLAPVLSALPEWAERTRDVYEALRRMIRAADRALGPEGVRPQAGDLSVRQQVVYVAALYDAAYTYGINNPREYAARILREPGYAINRRCKAATEQGLLVKDERGRYVPPHAQQEGTESE